MKIKETSPLSKLTEDDQEKLIVWMETLKTIADQTTDDEDKVRAARKKCLAITWPFKKRSKPPKS